MYNLLIEISNSFVRDGKIGESCLNTLNSLEQHQWLSLYNLATRHGLIAVIYEAVKNCDGFLVLDKKYRLSWAINTEKIYKRYLAQLNLACNMSLFLNDNGIKIMFLKGLELSFLYSKPNCREFGDIDIYMFGDWEKGDSLLNKKLQVKINEDVHHHTTFTINDIMVENHFDFINRYAHKSSKSFEEILKKLAICGNNNICVDFNGEAKELLVPNENFNALFLVKHMAGHFAAEQIVIRHLLDWMLFLENYSTKVDWEQIYAYYKEYNLDKFINAINGILIDLFNMNPSLAYNFKKDENLQNRVWQEILEPKIGKMKDIKEMKKGVLGKVFWPLNVIGFKTIRFFSNKWKHDICYRESILESFIWGVRAKIIKGGFV